MPAELVADEQVLRYPIGRYQPPAPITATDQAAWITELEVLPPNLRAAVSDFTDDQLDTPYRPGGWTVRQVVHHLADSHINSYVRFRLALTEDSPSIKAYNEASWAKLPDANSAPVELSLSLLEGLHARWALLLQSFDPEAFARTLSHPELGSIRLDWLLGLYAWHGRHHLGHINALQRRMGW